MRKGLAVNILQRKLAFEDRAILTIPVAGDDFDLARATVPSPFHLQRLDAPAAPQ